MKILPQNKGKKESTKAATVAAVKDNSKKKKGTSTQQEAPIVKNKNSKLSGSKTNNGAVELQQNGGQRNQVQKTKLPVSSDNIEKSEKDLMQQQQMALQKQMFEQLGISGEGAEEQYQAYLEQIASTDQTAAFNGIMPSGAADMTGLNGMMGGFGGFGMGLTDLSGLGENAEDDDEFISEEDFQKQMDEQEKTIFNALVSSLLQNYMTNLKKFLKRRMDHLKNQSASEQEMATVAQQAHFLQAQALANYQNQLMSAGIGSGANPGMLTQFAQMNGQHEPEKEESPSIGQNQMNGSISKSKKIKSNFDQNNLSEEKKEITNGEQDQGLLDANGGQIEENVELTDLQAQQNSEKHFEYDDQQITDLVHKFFSQTSDERLKYMRMLKELLEEKLKTKFASLQKDIERAKNGEAHDQDQQEQENEVNANDDADANQLANLKPQFIEIVLQYIFNIYQREFEEKKGLLETESQRNQLQTSDVFDENDNQLIEELSLFIDQYQYSMKMLQTMQQNGDINQEDMENQDPLNVDQLDLNAVNQLIQGAQAQADNEGEELPVQNENDLLIQQLQSKLATYQGIQDQQKEEFNEQIEQEQIDPELIQKLQEYVQSDNRDELIQQISENDLIQLFQLAEQLQRSQTSRDSANRQIQSEDELANFNQIISQLAASQPSRVQDAILNSQPNSQDQRNFQNVESPIQLPNGGSQESIELDSAQQLQKQQQKQAQIINYKIQIKQENYNISRLEELTETDPLTESREPIRGCRHIYVAHLIRVHQAQQGLLDHEEDMDDMMNENQEQENLNSLENMEIDPQTEEVLNILKNLGPEGIQALQQMGLDLSQINLSSIQDLNNLAQFSQSVGGIENLLQHLEGQVNPEQIEDQQMYQEQDQQEMVGEDQQVDQDQIIQTLQEMNVDPSILEQLQQLSQEEVQQILQQPEMLQALIQNHQEEQNYEQELVPEETEQQLVAQNQQSAEQPQQTYQEFQSPEDWKQKMMIEEAQLKHEQEVDGDEGPLKHQMQPKSSKNLMKLINSTIRKKEHPLLNTAENIHKGGIGNQNENEDHRASRTSQKKNQNTTEEEQIISNAMSLGAVSQLTSDQISRIVQSIKHEKEQKNKMINTIRTDPNIQQEVVDLLPMALQTEEELKRSQQILQPHIQALKNDRIDLEGEQQINIINDIQQMISKNNQNEQSNKSPEVRQTIELQQQKTADFKRLSGVTINTVNEKGSARSDVKSSVVDSKNISMAKDLAQQQLQQMEKVLSIDKTPSVIQVANQGKSKLSNSVENASKNKPMNSEDSIKQQLFRSTVKDPSEGPQVEQQLVSKFDVKRDEEQV